MPTESTKCLYAGLGDSHDFKTPYSLRLLEHISAIGRGLLHTSDSNSIVLPLFYPCFSQNTVSLVTGYASEKRFEQWHPIILWQHLQLLSLFSLFCRTSILWCEQEQISQLDVSLKQCMVSLNSANSPAKGPHPACIQGRIEPNFMVSGDIPVTWLIYPGNF